MNKRSLISMLVSLCLVGVIGLGATFAYLSTTTGTLTNTFTVGNVNGTLLEVVDNEGTIVTATSAGTNILKAYGELLPNQTIVKQPYMTAATGSADAIAYIKVTGLDALVGLDDADGTQAFSVAGLSNNGWTRVSQGTNLDGIYRYGTTLSAGASTSVLFTGITFNSDIEGTTLASFGAGSGNIVLIGCLVQADDNADPNAVAIAKLP